MRGFYLLLIGFILFLVTLVGEAAKSESNKSKVYVVYMGGLSSQDGAAERSDHVQLLSELIQRKKDCVVQTYSKSFLGFAARLSDEEAKSIARRPGVVSVFLDRVHQLHTTRSWDFLKFQDSAFKTTDDHHSTASPTPADDDTIIGIIDTGITPEHPSFNDKNMGRIPARWKGECLTGINSTYMFRCNRKLIGSRYYDDPEDPGTIATARDNEGHGTHVASIAAGMPISGASYNGLAQGIARGGSPSSRIAVYRVCSYRGCPSSSILRAFDDAIADGVDVLSLSLGGSDEDLFTSPMDIGAFHAVENGITVVCSSGESGPFDKTPENVAPWLLTVAATTVDRDFEVDIRLGNHVVIKGEGITFFGLNESAVYRLVDGRSVDFNQTEAKGAIVLLNGFYDNYIDDLGAVGVIEINDYSRQVPFDYRNYTGAAVSAKDGARIQQYIYSTSNPRATILPTRMIPNNYKPAPVSAYFSSGGPTVDVKNLLKPDIAAPGVGILGAWILNDTTYNVMTIPGKKPPLFNILSGTSMACPHVSGIAATLKSMYPTWTPSAIKSAIMTTATYKNNLRAPITTYNGSIATPYDIGAGEVNLPGPLYPGLVYKTETTDYILFLCNMGYNASVIKSVSLSVPKNFTCPRDSSPDLVPDLNYPSILVSGLKANGRKTVKRTVTNVGEDESVYTASVEAAAGLEVQVVPKILRFTKTVTKLSFQVTFIPTATFKGPSFGSITLSNRKYNVRSPFVVSNA